MKKERNNDRKNEDRKKKEIMKQIKIKKERNR